MRCWSVLVIARRRSSRFSTRSPRRPASGTSSPLAGTEASRRVSRSPVRYAWLVRLFGAAMALYLRLVAPTFRVIGPATRDQVILSLWQHLYMAGFVIARK